MIVVYRFHQLIVDDNSWRKQVMPRDVNEYRDNTKSVSAVVWPKYKISVGFQVICHTIVNLCDTDVARLNRIIEYGFREVHFRLNGNGENRKKSRNHINPNSETVGNKRHNLVSLYNNATFMMCVLSTPVWYTTRLNDASCCEWFPNLDL